MPEGGRVWLSSQDRWVGKLNGMMDVLYIQSMSSCESGRSAFLGLTRDIHIYIYVCSYIGIYNT